MSESPTLMTEIFETVTQRMEDQSLESFDEYTELVDEVIAEQIDIGRMTDEEDSKTLREGLEQMWWQKKNAGEDADGDDILNHA